MTLLDYFAGQYMCNGWSVEKSYQFAADALVERKKYHL